jgi:hypothetical protein
MPCNDDMAYTFFWTLVEQPGDCDVMISQYTVTPSVYISNCDPCQYGEYVFALTQQNGYFDDAGAFKAVCTTTDEVSVWIYEQPENVDAGEDQFLCNTFAFTLNATVDLYCGDFGVNYNNWYTWMLVGQPEGAGCVVTITPDPVVPRQVGVSITGCTGECPYGEFIFEFTEYNGSELVYCEASDEVSVFIYEQPLADAGEDYFECVDAYNTPYILSMGGSMEYCYTMYGEWTKSCGPGLVTFEDVNDPMTEVEFNQTGKYVFVWTVWNETSTECMDTDTVQFYLLEQPNAMLENGYLAAECDELCVDLGDAGVTKFDYFGTDQGDCPNYNDESGWEYIDGPVAGFNDPASVTFAPDATIVDAELCVSYYGAYTVRWNEVNNIDGNICEDHVDVFVEFFETPDPFAGDDDEICGNCYTLQGVPYEYLPYPNQHLSDYYFWTALATNPCTVTFSDYEAAMPQVCIPDDPFGMCYGTYGFVFHQYNGQVCFGTDTVYITFNKIPDPVCLTYSNDSNCDDFNNYRGFE